MFTREAVSVKEIEAIASSFIPRELTPFEARIRDINMSRKLAKKACEYRAIGKDKMAELCDERANMAYTRAMKVVLEIPVIKLIEDV